MSITDRTKRWKLIAKGSCWLFFLSLISAAWSSGPPAPQRSAFFGDTHIHTYYSMDAFMSGGVRTTPDDAYRYAKGEAIPHVDGSMLRLNGAPLDFLMVSDHAAYLGVHAALSDPSSPTFEHPESDLLVPESNSLADVFEGLLTLAGENHELLGRPVIADAWQKTIEAAERHNQPGQFTAFIGYEYTPTPGSRHLHRNVVFRGANVPEEPFSARDSSDPENLWNWMDGLRAKGMDSIAIPHNMNQSDGLAFMTQTWRGDDIDKAFALKRMRNEPIAEISQQKGTSETHPSLSPNDEWADFQIVQYFLNRRTNSNPISTFKGGYWRDALRTGLALKAEVGTNPFQLGAIGASDSHVSAGPYEEESLFALADNSPVARGSAYAGYENPENSWEGYQTGRRATHGTGGLAGVWAEENTRASLFDAMRRRETFATTGPRIRLRLFAGFEFSEQTLLESDLVAKAYAGGVPMGGVLSGAKAFAGGVPKVRDIPNAKAFAGGVPNVRDAPIAKDHSPQFLLWATRDFNEGWLQRAQIVKGWFDGDETYEKIYDVACSDGLEVDPRTHRCPDNGATVDLSDCSVSTDKGATELKAHWQDPDFSPQHEAFYYLRVLENPSCRWSTWDAIGLGITPNPDLPATQQERAWSSPIWYEPAR